jgi:putative transcriptional regulator
VNPRHHPSADILAAYAAGTHEPGFGLVVGAHVQTCAACRERVGAFEAASGAALADLPRSALGPDALEKVMARLEVPEPAPAPEAETSSFLARLPLKPRKWVAPGVWVAAVDTPHAPENRVYVLSAPKGMTAARHQHSGAEYCTVLSGAYRDELGVFSAGDFVAAESELNHQPIVDGQEACVCLFATEGRLKPKGLVGRLAFALADV